MAGLNYRYYRATLPPGGSVKTTTLPQTGQFVYQADRLRAVFLLLRSCRQQPTDSNRTSASNDQLPFELNWLAAFAILQWVRAAARDFPSVSGQIETTI